MSAFYYLIQLVIFCTTLASHTKLTVYVSYDECYISTTNRSVYHGTIMV